MGEGVERSETDEVFFWLSSYFFVTLKSVCGLLIHRYRANPKTRKLVLGNPTAVPLLPLAKAYVIDASNNRTINNL